MNAVASLPSSRPAIRFDVAAAEAAYEAWKATCGPAAIAAILGLTFDELRPHMADNYESKGYLAPMAMQRTLDALKVKRTTRVSPINGGVPWPIFGLARIQWDGPWCKEGVPIPARYRKTHWVASSIDSELHPQHAVFDINATCVGGWIPGMEWSVSLVPWLLEQVEPKATGKWWITHSIELDRSAP